MNNDKNSQLTIQKNTLTMESKNKKKKIQIHLILQKMDQIKSPNGKKYTQIN